MLPDTLQGTCRTEDTTSWKYGKTHRSNVLHLAAVNSHREVLPSTVKQSCPILALYPAYQRQILLMWWWFPLRTDLHLQNFGIQVPRTISAFPSADPHESGNMLEHHLPFYKSSNPFKKKQAKVPLLTSSDSSAFISLSISGISGGCSARS